MIKLFFIKPFLKSLVSFFNSLKTSFCKPIFYLHNEIMFDITLLKFWSNLITKSREKYQWEIERTANSNHHENPKLMKIIELAHIKKNASNERSNCSICNCNSNLLKTSFNSIFPFIINTLVILMAHMHNVINWKPNENNKRYWFSNPYS